MGGWSVVDQVFDSALRTQVVGLGLDLLTPGVEEGSLGIEILQVVPLTLLVGGLHVFERLACGRDNSCIEGLDAIASRHHLGMQAAIACGHVALCPDPI